MTPFGKFSQPPLNAPTRCSSRTSRQSAASFSTVNRYVGCYASRHDSMCDQIIIQCLDNCTRLLRVSPFRNPFLISASTPVSCNSILAAQPIALSLTVAAHAFGGKAWHRPLLLFIGKVSSGNSHASTDI